MKYALLMLTLFLLVFNCFAADKAQSSTYTVQLKPNVQSYLYFQGNISPINSVHVLSPIAGIVSDTLGFTYGANVKKGQLLFSLTPNDEQNSYRQALISYLRAKSSYNDAVAKFNGQKVLYENKILARNDFQQFKDNLVNQKLTMQESLYSLQAVIKKISSNPKVEHDVINSLANLSLNDSGLYQELNRSFDKVKINAPISGVALVPPKDSDGDNSATQLHKDSVVKLDQLILVVGDFSGLKVNIDVSEVSINKLKLGQDVEITGPAFPGVTLKGKVSSISYQSKSGEDSGGLPQFPVTVSVKKLTAAQQKIIHAGMTAQVKISLAQGNQIMVPIKAVTTTDGKSYVQLLQNGKPVKTEVTTGNTTPTEVAIIKGLKAGDKIAVSN